MFATIFFISVVFYVILTIVQEITTGLKPTFFKRVLNKGF